MPPTKKSVRYRPGSTSGCDNCDRCTNFMNGKPEDNGLRNRCCFLEAPVGSHHTCQEFEQDPEWRNPYESF